MRAFTQLGCGQQTRSRRLSWVSATILIVFQPQTRPEHRAATSPTSSSVGDIDSGFLSLGFGSFVTGGYLLDLRRFMQLVWGFCRSYLVEGLGTRGIWSSGL